MGKESVWGEGQKEKGGMNMSKEKRIFVKKDFDCDGFSCYTTVGQITKPFGACVQSIKCNWQGNMQGIEFRIDAFSTVVMCVGFYKKED
jgi:hypothetical protein